jgi:hypothetical protein
MPPYNVCYGEGISCSACCGINNIGLTGDEKKKWLHENTNRFLNINVLDSHEVLNFRHSGEEFLKKIMLRTDVYVCPFMGFTGKTGRQTGCLLNIGGSPHSQIRETEAPQHFSFYGESICKSYDCLGKQSIHTAILQDDGAFYRRLLAFLGARLDAAEYDINPQKFDCLLYNKFISNHNLVAVYQKIVCQNPKLEKALLVNIIQKLENTEIPVTSFEMPLTLEFFTDEQLWHVLGTLFRPEGYIFEAFEITPLGIEEGNQIKLASEI